MLKLASQMDEDTRIKCALANWVAVDENCGPLTRESNPIHLRRSGGHRKAGRPTRYYIHGTGNISATEVLAYSDDEATEKANQMLGFDEVQS
jgi:hypothetical protein